MAVKTADKGEELGINKALFVEEMFKFAIISVGLSPME